jgi:chromatin structure-remodeling complex subunit RSC1/2
MTTPTLPPQPTNGYGGDSQRNYPIAQAPVATPMPAPTPQPHHIQTAYTPTHPTQYHTHSASPVPHAPQHPAQQSAGYQAITPHLPFSTPSAPPPVPQYASRPAPTYQQSYVQQPPGAYKAPQPVEVYILNDHANASIPPEIREQFQRDEQGRVLFFTAPPLNTQTVVNRDGRPLGHSARFLAAKAARDAARAEKRKADEANAAEREEAAKKARAEAEENFKKDVAALSIKALNKLEDQLALATKQDFEALFAGNEGQDGILKSLEQLTEVQKKTMAKNLAREVKKNVKTQGHMPITGMTVRLEEKF